jgi:hypothetical protein
MKQLFAQASIAALLKASSAIDTPAALGPVAAPPQRRTLRGLHKKAGLSRKEREWREKGPSLAGRTDSSERMS